MKFVAKEYLDKHLLNHKKVYQLISTLRPYLLKKHLYTTSRYTLSLRAVPVNNWILSCLEKGSIVYNNKHFMAFVTEKGILEQCFYNNVFCGTAILDISITLYNYETLCKITFIYSKIGVAVNRASCQIFTHHEAQNFLSINRILDT